MKGDITIYDDGHGFPGTFSATVATGSNAYRAINAGEPVYIAVDGDGVATALATNLPTSADLAHTISGIAESTSTETASALGTIQVLKLEPQTTYLIAPKVALATDQATYDALVGKFVLLDLTGTAAAGTATYTILVAHGASYGCVIEPLDVIKHPGKVRFSLRPGCTSKFWVLAPSA